MRAPRTLFLRRLRRSRISRTSSRRAPLGIPSGRAGVGEAQVRGPRSSAATVAQPQSLQASASALGLGDAAFVHYTPPALSGDNGSFDPARNGR